MVFKVEVQNTSDGPIAIAPNNIRFRALYTNQTSVPMPRPGARAPREEELVVMRAGETVVRDMIVMARLAGRMTFGARLEAHGRFVRRLGDDVERPDLWEGCVSVATTARIAPREDFGGVEGVPDLAVYLAGGLTMRERLVAMSRLAVSEPSERTVMYFRKRLDEAPSNVERVGCAMYLLLAAQEGYGIGALPDFIRIARDENRPDVERLIALEGVALGRGYAITHHEQGYSFSWKLDSALRTEAAATLKALAANEWGAVGKRAAEFLREE